MDDSRFEGESFYCDVKYHGVISGDIDCVNVCVCGAPFCHMHFKSGAGFCNDQHIVYNEL